MNNHVVTDSSGFSYETQKGVDLEYTSIRDATDHGFARVISTIADFPEVGSYVIEIDLGDSGIYDVAQAVPEDLSYEETKVARSERRRLWTNLLDSEDRREIYMSERGLTRNGGVDKFVPSDLADHVIEREDKTDRNISSELVKTAEITRNEEWIRFSHLGESPYALLSTTEYEPGIAAYLASSLNPPKAKKLADEDQNMEEINPELEEADQDTLEKVFNRALEEQSSTDLSESDIGSDLQDTSRS